jgi:hypothetical protein
VLFVSLRALGLAVLFVWSQAVGRDAHARLVRWDSQWYAGIARNGYGFTRLVPDGRSLSDYAFFPLYPALERVVSAVTGLRYVDSGLLLSAVASVLAAWAIFAVGDLLHGRRAGLLLVVLWAVVPVAIVESMAYSESLFTALAAWSIYAVIKQRWLAAGVLAAFAGLTRPVGVAVAASVVVSAGLMLLRERRTVSTRAGGTGHRAAMIGALIAPVGWCGYIVWVGVRTGSPFGYFEVAGGWGNGFDGGRAFARWIGSFLTGPDFVLGLLLCLAVVALAWLLVLCIRQRQPPALIVFAGVIVLIMLTTSGYFGSKPRYLLPAFPLLLPIAVRLGRIRPAAAVAALAVLAAGSAAYGAFWLLGAGPP